MRIADAVAVVLVVLSGCSPPPVIPADATRPDSGADDSPVEMDAFDATRSDHIDRSAPDAGDTTVDADARDATPDDGDATDSADTIDVRDGTDATDAGTDTIDAVVPTASNTSCGTARLVSDGTRLVGENAAAATRTETICLSFSPHPSLYYRMRVPAQRALAVRVTATAAWPWRPTAQITDPCESPTRRCLGGFFTTSSTDTHDPDYAYYRNDTGADRDVMILIGAGDALPPGTFDVSFDLVAPAPNADCASPIPIVDGSSFTHVDLLGAWRRVMSCPSGGATDGNVLFYRASLPPGTYLDAQMTARGPVTWRPRVRVFDDCLGTTCLGESPTADREVLVRNDTGATRDVIVAASADYYIEGIFDLDASIRPSPTNNVCSGATPLADGTHLVAEDVRLATESLASVCAPEVTENVLYYRATVPAGELFAAIVRPLNCCGGTELRLLDSCVASTCNAFSSNVGGASESVVWQNTGASSADVYLAVSGRDFILKTADIYSTIARPAYTRTVVPASCETLDAPTTVAGVSAMSTASSVLMLPFPLTFFGTSESHYSVSWSGLLQFYDSASGSPSRDFYMPSIPNVDGPHGFAAPFWMPLGAIPSGSSVHTQVFGTSPSRRFVVEWTDWSAHAPADASRVTFQAKVFEGTNAIEFHYCRLDPVGATPPAGTRVRVGLEDSTGLRGVVYPIDRGAILSTTEALRFDPAP